MKTTGRGIALAMICGATIAVAKEGVTNDAVKARTETMQVIKNSTRTLGSMVQGRAAFDPEAAAKAATLLAAAAANITPMFKTPATDPKSEAKPDIWTNWEDFTAKATALKTGAEGLDTSSLAALKASFGSAARTCKACHSKYRL